MINGQHLPKVEREATKTSYEERRPANKDRNGSHKIPANQKSTNSNRARIKNNCRGVKKGSRNNKKISGRGHEACGSHANKKFKLKDYILGVDFWRDIGC